MGGYPGSHMERFQGPHQENPYGKPDAFTHPDSRSLKVSHRGEIPSLRESKFLNLFSVQSWF